MSRVIKFRAYDKPNSEMVYSDKEDCFYINTKGSMFMYSQPKSVAGKITEYVRDYDLMQFTGLTDKNGVDNVYEDDIIDSNGLIIGNTHESQPRESDLVIPRITSKDWQAAYKEGLARGLSHA